MKIAVFLHGTTIMHKSALGCPREERVKQVEENETSVHDYASYIPVGDAVKKLNIWKDQGAEILYISSQQSDENLKADLSVLKKYGFPDGQFLYRKQGQMYKDIAEQTMPDVLIEDDCESIGGANEMTITHVNPDLKVKIKSIVVKEFEGIDHLPNKISALLTY